jgi:hypothetical protein
VQLEAALKDALVASGAEVVLKAALAATDTLPIVMTAIDYDPLALGYLKSLARPGGNVTGIFFQQIELTTKRLQVVTDATRVMYSEEVLGIPGQAGACNCSVICLARALATAWRRRMGRHADEPCYTFSQPGLKRSVSGAQVREMRATTLMPSGAPQP